MPQTPSLPLVTAFKDSPDRGRGLARDMRVRWAFEEVGQAYDVQLVSFDEMKTNGYAQLQPFHQIPAYREGDMVLFESGAIVLHIAETHGGLLPAQAAPRARAISWMFSALNTIEPPTVEREAFLLLEKNKPYFQERLPILDARLSARFKQLSLHLGGKDWLDGEFSAGDLLMVTVLQRSAALNVLSSYENLSAYIERAEARPAYKRAFAAQLAVYNESQKTKA